MKAWWRTWGESATCAVVGIVLGTFGGYWVAASKPHAPLTQPREVHVRCPCDTAMPKGCECCPCAGKVPVEVEP